MVDHFARLNLPRRPWMDGEQLRQRFHDLSADAHPDRSHNADAAIKVEKQDDFTEINEAYQCLDDAKCRVRHLIELERGKVPDNVQSIPAEMTDWFMEIGDTCRKVDAFLVKKEKQDSPMMQATLMVEGLALNDEVSALHSRLQKELARVDAELLALCPEWEALDGQGEDRADTLPLAKLEALGQRLSFWVKWSAQLGERSSRLMF